MIDQPAEHVLDVLDDAGADLAAIRAAAQELMAQIRSPEDATRALKIIAPGMATGSGEKGLLVTMLCGALAERDADAQPMVEPMLDRLRRIVPAAREFYDACVVDIPAGAEDRGEHFEKNYKRLAGTMPQAGAWQVLEAVFPPCIAMFSASPAARRAGQDLVADFRELSEFNQAAHWLHKILCVLDDEAFIAIEPSTGIGVVGRMSGISENFQLNVLLMDAFPQRGWFAKRRVSKAAADIARGDGPQQGDEILSGCWNLYTWRAARPDGSLPDPKDLKSSGPWIWNEGIPSDIPSFDGHRVILLAPSSYQRTWKSQRDFLRMKANLTIERELDRQALRQWLERFAAGQ